MKKLLTTAVCALAVMSANADSTYSLNTKGFDPNVAASADFFQHINKQWLEEHPLTDEYSRYGQFNVLNDTSNNRIQRLVMGLAATNPQPGSVAYKVSSIYELAMDSVRRNKLGAQPIMAQIKKIQDARPEEMDALTIWMHDEIASPFFGMTFFEDLANSNEYAMYLAPGSLGLGDRDYYLKKDKDSQKVLKAYEKRIVDLMKLAGFSKKDANRIMKNVIKIETAIADSAMTREESRNYPAQYNPRTLAQAKAMYPNLPWEGYFSTVLRTEEPETIIVMDFKGLNQSNNLYKNTTDREKKDYYLWQLVKGASPYLSDAFGDANFEFSKVMSGVSAQRPRWKRALDVTEDLLGEAIGELYVKEYFPQSSKDYMINLVENLRTALGKHIINLPWMSDDTKLAAIKKLNAFTVKIGYPDKWKDYSTMNIDPSLSYYDNVFAAKKWASEEYLKKWGKPVDKTEWQMTPQTINAYYNPTANEIVFPAGILQAPFFDPRSSDAENYGGIGVVIGHEMTHGFDDQGSMFDANGNMCNWWAEEDAEAFKDLTQGLAAQFDAIEVLPGLHANGQYTLGENIADQGGLRVARTAFLDSQKKKGIDVDSEEAKIDGLTPMQVFYANYANIWAQNQRDEEIRTLTISDVHSLAKNRVNVSLKNIAPFFEAFKIKEGDPMFLKESDRVIIW